MLIMKIMISRSFIEFGPFTMSEIHDFIKRGVLFESDYAKNESSEEWMPVQELAREPVKQAPVPVAEKAKQPAVSKAKANPSPKKASVASSAKVSAPVAKKSAKKTSKN